MRNLVVNYDVIGRIDKKILVLADFHNLSTKDAINLANSIQNEESDLIILAGDIIQGPKYRDKRALENLKRFLAQISEGTPVVLEKGNHDLVGYDQESRKGYLSLENARKGMVFPLDNSAVTIDGMRIIGVCPTRPAFAPSLQESGGALLHFSKDFKEAELEKEIDPNLYNILICHNPKIFAQAISVDGQRHLQLTSEEAQELRELSEVLRKIDLVAAGHLHSGYIPLTSTIKNPDKYLDLGIWEMPMEKDIHEKTTFVRPWVMKKTDMCRGVIYVGPEEERFIQLSNGHLYFQDKPYNRPIQVSRGFIDMKGKVPIAISGGVNKYFNLPVDAAEITSVNVKRLTR